MKILLIGGGNSTHIFAILAKHNNYEVVILSREPKKWSNNLLLENRDLELIKQNQIMVSGVRVVSDYSIIESEKFDMIVLAGIPVEFYEEIMVKISPYINYRIYLGSVCAYGGFDLIAKKIFKTKYHLLKIFGFQSIPWTCGIKEYGKSVILFGGKPVIHVATNNIDEFEKEELT